MCFSSVGQNISSCDNDGDDGDNDNDRDAKSGRSGRYICAFFQLVLILGSTGQHNSLTTIYISDSAVGTF